MNVATKGMKTYSPQREEKKKKLKSRVFNSPPKQVWNTESKRPKKEKEKCAWGC